jgi:hypothetical protein
MVAVKICCNTLFLCKLHFPSRGVICFAVASKQWGGEKNVCALLRCSIYRVIT